MTAFSRKTSAPPAASPRQVEYVQRLAAEALVEGELDQLIRSKFGKALSALSRPEASALISLLKDLRRGAQRLDEIIPGAAA